MEIKIIDLSYKYPNSKKLVLDNININFMAHKVNGIIGKSGSGKTTLLELIDGLINPTFGKIEIEDYILNNKTKDYKDVRANIGYMFQFPEYQFFNDTVKQEIQLNSKLYNYRISEIDKRTDDVLKMVGLAKDCLNKDPLLLSHGEARKVALASILIFNPKVIVLDEPTIGLDNKSKLEFIRLIRMLKNRYKKTIIIVTHDIEMLHKIVDNVIVLNDGKVVLQGDKYNVFKETRLLKTYGIISPKVILFSNKVLNKKNIKLGYRDEINDLIKDIFRNVK